jgi:hypothetical protein
MKYTLLEEKTQPKKPLPDILQILSLEYIHDGKPVPATELETFHYHQPVKLRSNGRGDVSSMDCVSPCDDESRDNGDPSIKISRVSSCVAVCDPFNRKACFWMVICWPVAYLPLGLLDLSYYLYSSCESVKLRYQRRQENRVASDFFNMEPSALMSNKQKSLTLKSCPAPSPQSMV